MNMRKWVIVLTVVLALGGCGEDLMEESENGKETTGSRGTTKDTVVDDESPLNVSEWEAASALLTDAAAMVGERGFQQEATEDVYAVCVATALERSFFQGDYSIVDFNYARDALSQVLGVPRDPEADPNLPVDVPYWGRHLMEWNDEAGRTEGEVLSLFRDAAELARDQRDRADELNA
jgi:hypothetical protein